MTREIERVVGEVHHGKRAKGLLTGRHVVVKVEEQHDQESERRSNESPLDLDIPEIDHPASIKRRMESLGDRHPLEGDQPQAVLREP